MMKDIQKYWPFKSSPMRKTQEDVLEWVESLPDSIRYIIIEAPVGAGKSPIALNISGWLSRGKGNAVIMTPQKILQNQYERSFERTILSSLYGKVNYPCENKRTNCEIGSDIKPQCPNCPHKKASLEAEHAPNVVLNYRLGLLAYLLGMKYTANRSCVVFDEAHTLENHLTEFMSAYISERSCKKYGVTYRTPNSLYDALDWVRSTYYPAVKQKLQYLRSEFSDIESIMEMGGVGSMNNAQLEVLQELKEVREHHATLYKIVNMTDQDIDDRYVFVPEKTSFRFKELFGKHIFTELFIENDDIKKMIFLSSTILNVDEFCKNIGIEDRSEVAFVSMESEFDVDSRPVIYNPITKMNYGWDKPERKKETDKMVDAIVDICKSTHAEHNGVIHTGSYAVASYLIKSLSGKIPHTIFSHQPEEEVEGARDLTIEAFQTEMKEGEPPRLLISPSVTEGLDLKEDLGRFAIFAKVPYPYMGDAWVKRRMDLSESWYSLQAMIHIIQGGGRVVRSPTDWGYTYILDESFGGLYKRMKKYIPKWWKNAYIES